MRQARVDERWIIQSHSRSRWNIVLPVLSRAYTLRMDMHGTSFCQYRSLHFQSANWFQRLKKKPHRLLVPTSSLSSLKPLCHVIPCVLPPLLYPFSNELRRSRAVTHAREWSLRATLQKPSRHHTHQSEI